MEYFTSTRSLEKRRYLPALAEPVFSNRAGERWEQKVEKRSAPLRSGSMFFGDLAAVNLKVDHFSFVSSFQHSHMILTKGVLILSTVLLKSFLQF